MNPFNKKIEYKECPECIGSGEVFVRDKNEFILDDLITGETIACPECNGDKEIQKEYFDYTDEQDHLDDYDEDAYDNYTLSEEDGEDQDDED